MANAKRRRLSSENPPLPWWPSQFTGDEAAVVPAALCIDLWWFIENVTEDDPERQARFFELRERYRETVQG